MPSMQKELPVSESELYRHTRKSHLQTLLEEDQRVMKWIERTLFLIIFWPLLMFVAIVQLICKAMRLI